MLSMVLVSTVLLNLLRDLLRSRLSTTRNLGYVFLLLDALAVSESVGVSISFRVVDSRSALVDSFGVGGEHEGKVSLCSDILILVCLVVAFISLHTKTRVSIAWGWKPTSLRTHRPWPAPRFIQAPTATPPQRGSLFLWHRAHQAMFWTPTWTPHRDAFLHHLWSGVAQYSVCEVPQDKRKVRDQRRGGRTSHLDILDIWPVQACSLSFLGTGQQSAVHRPNMHT